MEGLQQCFGCKQPITQGENYLKVSSQCFHEEHFVCVVCNCKLNGKRFFPKDEQFYCQEHYEEKFCFPCAGCGQRITVGGVLRAFDLYYHPEHFRCSNPSCKKILDGQYYQKEGRPYCHVHALSPDPSTVTATACNLCGQPVADHEAVWAADSLYHAACLSCAACNVSLTRPGDVIFRKDAHLFCKRDYENQFLQPCTACGSFISDTCMTTNDEYFHPECFRCAIADCGQTLAGYFSRDGELRCQTHAHAARGDAVCINCHTDIRCSQQWAPADRQEIVPVVGAAAHASCMICIACEKPLSKREARKYTLVDWIPSGSVGDPNPSLGLVTWLACAACIAADRIPMHLQLSADGQDLYDQDGGLFASLFKVLPVTPLVSPKALPPLAPATTNNTRSGSGSFPLSPSSRVPTERTAADRRTAVPLSPTVAQTHAKSASTSVSASTSPHHTRGPSSSSQGSQSSQHSFRSTPTPPTPTPTPPTPSYSPRHSRGPSMSLPAPASAPGGGSANTVASASSSSSSVSSPLVAAASGALLLDVSSDPSPRSTQTVAPSPRIGGGGAGAGASAPLSARSGRRQSNSGKPGDAGGKRSGRHIKDSASWSAMRPQQETDSAESGKIQWTKGQMIGKGSFGKVYMGLNARTGELIAVKQVQLTTEEDMEQADSLRTEITLMEKLRHPNIVALLGSERDGDKFNILMEFVPGKSIDALLETFGKLNISTIRIYTRQMLSALKYLHKNGVVHRDIKGKNVLVDAQGNCKLCDFGSAKQFQDVMSKAAPSIGYNYTPLWTAPEVLIGDYDRKVDLWSLGCVVIEMASARPPWDECKFDNPFRALYHIGNTNAIPKIPELLENTPMMPDGVTPIGVDFLKQCLTRDPTLRPDAKELIRHPFVADVDHYSDDEDDEFDSLSVADSVAEEDENADLESDEPAPLLSLPPVNSLSTLRPNGPSFTPAALPAPTPAPTPAPAPLTPAAISPNQSPRPRDPVASPRRVSLGLTVNVAVPGAAGASSSGRRVSAVGVGGVSSGLTLNVGAPGRPDRPAPSPGLSGMRSPAAKAVPTTPLPFTRLNSSDALVAAGAGSNSISSFRSAVSSVSALTPAPVPAAASSASGAPGANSPAPGLGSPSGMSRVAALAKHFSNMNAPAPELPKSRSSFSSLPK